MSEVKKPNTHFATQGNVERKREYTACARLVARVHSVTCVRAWVTCKACIKAERLDEEVRAERDERNE